MKKYLFSTILILAVSGIFTSCLECRCKEPEQQALSMPKDKELVGVWKLKELTVFSINWLYFDANGKYKYGEDYDELQQNTVDRIWYTTDGKIYYYSCIDYNPGTSDSSYRIINDTLEIFGKSSDIYTYIRVK